MLENIRKRISEIVFAGVRLVVGRTPDFRIGNRWYRKPRWRLHIAIGLIHVAGWIHPSKAQ